MFLYLCSQEPEVPPNAELSLEAELLEATDAPDLELLPPAKKISLASHKRERGNAHYQRGDYAFAVNSYSIALQITESSSKGERYRPRSQDSAKSLLQLGFRGHAWYLKSWCLLWFSIFGGFRFTIKIKTNKHIFHGYKIPRGPL